MEPNSPRAGVAVRRAPGRSNATRQRIMVVVEELLSHKRLDELQVNDIVTAATISRPTFYAHFDTKYSVVAAQIRTMGAAILDLWAPLFDGSGPVRHDVVLECARATIRSWRERPALCIAATEGWHSNAEIHEAWNPVILQFNGAATERIARTDLVLAHPEATAAALVSMFERCMYSTVAVPDSPLFNADEILAEVMASIWTRVLS